MHKMSRNYCRYPSSSCVKKVAFISFCANLISFLQCYVQYMKFSRRSEGTPAARAIFKKVTNSIKTKWPLFVVLAN